MVAVRPEPERSVAAVKTSSRRLYPKGSPSGEIASIRETRDGTLWVGTYAGLVRLEGERFVPEGAGVFPKGIVWCLFEDVDGVLWIGTGDCKIQS